MAGLGARSLHRCSQRVEHGDMHEGEAEEEEEEEAVATWTVKNNNLRFIFVLIF